MNLQTMIKEAQRWKGATINADRILKNYGASNRERLRHSNMTTKSDLDNYLMRKFGIGAVEARGISNTLTAENLPADRSAMPEEYRGEPWADNVINFVKEAWKAMEVSEG
ncbi:MAG: hypothetical protein PHS46_08035 [Candidatus Omnitrophica bacterium]|nr:hypothetical protein [Candidatus Omnitrophota bacterium]